MVETNADLAAVVHEITTTIEREGNVRAIFGEPMKLETRTVIPVARIAMGAGGGGVRSLGAAIDTVRRWLSPKRVHAEPSRTLAGGGGGGLDVHPVGFLCEENGRVVFTRIDDGREHVAPKK
jgi:uncharacterized spore protein YtfJ